MCWPGRPKVSLWAMLQVCAKTSAILSYDICVALAYHEITVHISDLLRREIDWGSMSYMFTRSTGHISVLSVINASANHQAWTSIWGWVVLSLQYWAPLHTTARDNHILITHDYRYTVVRDHTNACSVTKLSLLQVFWGHTSGSTLEKSRSR